MTTSEEQTNQAPATATAKSAAPASKGRVAKRRADAAPPKAKAARKATRAKKPTKSRRGAKTAKILELLKRPGGATLKDIMKATAWQPHSVRGFLSGTLRKKMGTPVESFQSSEGQRSYRIASK